MSKVARFLLFGLVIIFFAHAQDLQNTKLFLTVQELKPGEDCYVFATLGKDGIKPYKGEVRGVLKNAVGPHLDLIVIEVYGEPFGETGIYGGMSGAPVCVKRKGKWYKIGNISRGGLFARKSLAYLTPIHDVLAAEYDSTTAQRTSSRLRSVVPFSLTGLEILEGDKHYEEILKNLFRCLRIDEANLIGGFSGADSGVSRASQVSAGKVLGIQFMWGDIDLTGYGTVAHVDGEKIWLLGHPLLGLGPTEYRIVDAEVLDYQSNYARSYIVPRSTGIPLGVITQDRNTGVFGKLGELPKKTIPVTVIIKESNGVKRTVKFETVNDPFLTPQLLAYGVFISVISHMRYYGDVTIFEKEQISVMTAAGKIDTLISSRAYVSSDSAPIKMHKELLDNYLTIFQNPYSDVQVKGLEYEFSVFDERREKEISKVYFVDDKPYFDRSDETILKIILTQPRRQAIILDFPFKIPADVRDGKGKILVGNSLAIEEEEGSQRGGPGTLKSLLEGLKSERRKDAIYVYIQYPPYELEKENNGVTIKGARKISKRIASNIEEYEIVLEGFSINGSAVVGFKVGKDGEDKK
jgi:hypothetical protein